MSEIAVLFDMDGVIINNNDFHRDAFHVFNKKHNIFIPDNEFKSKVFGKTNAEVLRMLFGDHLSDAEIDDLAEEKEAMFRELYDPHFILSEGLSAFLERLKTAGIPLAVGTNAPQSNLTYTLNRGGIAHYFSAQVTPLLVQNPKPAPDIYRKAAELLGIAPERCIVFEDSLTGIQAAKGAGAKVIAITSTYSRAELEQVADRVIDSFNEVETPQLYQLLDVQP